ncbi:MAG: BatA domain-containing protein, partial [Hyphomicrobiaceae bacterium]
MIGSLAFASPWLLAGLLALPVIWWLLRTTPPSPTRVAFPPTRILRDLINREKTPARSPWWLTLIRMAAAAAIIFALAEPVLNPNRVTLAGADRLVLVIDNGWSSAARWDMREATVARLLASAESAGRPVLVLPTAGVKAKARLRFVPTGAARDRAASILPLPYAPDRAAALKQLSDALREAGDAATQIVWLGDGYDHRSGKAFADGLVSLAGSAGGVTLLDPVASERALALRRKPGDARALKAEVLSAPVTTVRTGRVIALSQKGQPIASSEFLLAPGNKSTEVIFTLPLEIRNQIARMDIQGEASSGAVHLLDARSRWNRVGLVAGANREKAQPLLSPLYYLVRALKPFTDVVESPEPSTALALDDLLKRRASTIILSNIGNLIGQSGSKLEKWVKKGGVLVRFAGPRLEQGDDPLLPSPLRFGGRTLGGALSWQEPQKLAPMDENGLFAGLTVTDEVSVRRQVLADPAQIGLETKVWARLTDGTPLVTARALGDGWLVLFHITANSDWSNLPLSGLFVDMLRRVLTLGQGAASGASSVTEAADG